MKLIKITGLMAGLTLLVACVTINIYFPAAQAEQAAERIVDDILGEKPAEETPKQDQGAGLLPAVRPPLFAGLFGLLLSDALAAQPDFNVNTPKIRSLQASMKKRNGSLHGFYASGAIGFGRDALIALRNPSALPLKQRKLAQKLVQDDNRDRNALYQAIADANGHPEWEPQIRATFAKTWIQKAAPGWWYQDDAGKWKQK